MALGYMQGNDPLTAAAPILKSGPSAYDTWNARAKQEQGDAALAQKAAADKAAIEEKQKARIAKDYVPASGTPYFTHTLYYNQLKAAHQQQLSAAALRHANDKAGVYGDPYDETDVRPGGGGSPEIALARQNVIETANRSLQMGKVYEDAMKYVNEHPDAVRPGAKEQMQTWISDHGNLTKGQVAPPIIGNVDLQKAFAPLGEKIAPTVKAWGGIDPKTNAASTRSVEEVTDDQVRLAVDGFLANPIHQDQAKYDLEGIKHTDPERYKRIEKLSKESGIPLENAMMYDWAKDVYGYEKAAVTQGGVSDAGMGRADEEAGLAWFTQLAKGSLTGEYKGGSGESDQPVDPKMGGLPVGTLPGPDGTKIIPAFKNLVWDTKKETVSSTNEETGVTTTKVIDRVKEVKKYVVDDKNKEVRVSIGVPGSDDIMETKVVPFNHVESEIIAPLAAQNKALIKEKGAWDRTNQRVYGLDPNESRGNNYVLPSDGGGKKKVALYTRQGN